MIFYIYIYIYMIFYIYIYDILYIYIYIYMVFCLKRVCHIHVRPKVVCKGKCRKCDINKNETILVQRVNNHI